MFWSGGWLLCWRIWFVMARVTNCCKVSPQFCAVWFSWFLSVPGMGMVRLIVWLGFAGLGLCGIAFD